MRDGALHVLLWQRARDPFSGAWALPGGELAPEETLEASISRHLAAKVDVRDVAHLEQLGTWSDPERHPAIWELATAYLGLVPVTSTIRHLPSDTRWHRVDELPATAFDHGAIVLAGRERLRGKLSYTNVGFALAPPVFTLAELRDRLRRRRSATTSRRRTSAASSSAAARSSRRASGGSPVRAGGARRSSFASAIAS